MTRSLNIASDLRLPIDAVTQTFAIFGKRGSGKTNTATVLAEEMLAVAPIVVLTPLDNWWGLKASFDGLGPGLSVYVFGGAHADLPLDPSAGDLMADVFIQHRISMVLCTKGWSVGERARFVAAFAKRLLDRNGGVPVHVFMEEADAFVPQRPAKGEEAMLGEMDRLVRWGRGEGIGATLITQRSAKVNKDVTTQAETLIAHRTVGPQDRDAIDAWIRFHASGDERAEVLSTLPTLPDGTAWIWSPEWLGILRQVRVRRRQTYDSASTPKVGEKRLEPKQLANVDLESLRDRLTVTIEKAKAEDPRELRKQIRDLERELAAARAATPTTEIREVERVVEVPVWPTSARELGVTLRDVAPRLMELAERFTLDLGEPPNSPVRPLAPARAAPPLVRPAQTPRPVSSGDGSITGPQQRILDALAWLESVGIPEADKLQVALLADASPKSSAFANNLGRLRSEGLITKAGLVSLTEQGRVLAAAPPGNPTTDDLHHSLFSRLPVPQVRILQAVIKVHPDGLDKAELAERAGASVTSSAFANNLGRLRSLGLISKTGPVTALPVLFLEDRRSR